MSEKKTDWGGIAILGAVVVGAYLLTRKVEAAPTPTPTQPPTQEPAYAPGQGNIVASNREAVGKAKGQTITAGQAGTAPSQKWEDPTQAPLFHFSKYPAGVPPQPGQVVGVQVPRPWAGVQGDGLFQKAIVAPLYWSGPPETAGLILVPERYRAIIEKYGLTTLNNIVLSPGDPRYAEVKNSGLTASYIVELLNGTARGNKVEYVTQQHMRTIANMVDERFLNDWVLGASITHPQGDPGTTKARASQMGLTEDQYKYIGLRYFYELHGYIPDRYRELWNRLDPLYHDSWKGFPKPTVQTYASPSGSGETYTKQEYQETFGTIPWDKPLPTYHKDCKQWYIWRDPLKPGSVLWGRMDDYKRSMAEAEKAKGKKAAMEKEVKARKPKEYPVIASPMTGVTPAPPVSKPQDPRGVAVGRTAAVSKERAKAAEASKIVTETLQRINRAAPGPRRG